jgi:hypothetical protein
MKALAAEVTEKLGKRLAWLGIKVRELTGDMLFQRIGRCVLSHSIENSQHGGIRFTSTSRRAYKLFKLTISRSSMLLP